MWPQGEDGPGLGLYTPAAERTCGKHPSQKPLALLERLVLVATSPDDLILDPFGGAGTLALAAQKHSRH